MVSIDTSERSHLVQRPNIKYVPLGEWNYIEDKPSKLLKLLKISSDL